MQSCQVFLTRRMKNITSPVSEKASLALYVSLELSYRSFMSENLPPETFVQLTDALEKGRMIDAIKVYREATGLGLKESKNAVETLYAELRNQDPDRFPERKQASGCSSSAAMIALLFVLVFYFTYPA